MFSNLDKRECPTERLLTRKKVIHRVLFSGGFPIGNKHPASGVFLSLLVFPLLDPHVTFKRHTHD